MALADFRVIAEIEGGAMSEQEWLEAFIKRAGFTYGWMNLESWARRMAEQAYEERNAAHAEGQIKMRERVAAALDNAETLEDCLAVDIRAMPIEVEPHPPSRLCGCDECRPSFEGE